MMVLVIMIPMMILLRLNLCSILFPICMDQIMNGVVGNDNLSVNFGVFHNLSWKSNL